MSRYVLRRLFQSIRILLGVMVFTFIFIQLVPGDYIDTLIDPEKSGTHVVMRHAIRNALLPLITVTGLSSPTLVGGSVVSSRSLGGLVSALIVSARLRSVTFPSSWGSILWRPSSILASDMSDQFDA